MLQVSGAAQKVDQLLASAAVASSPTLNGPGTFAESIVPNSCSPRHRLDFDRVELREESSDGSGVDGWRESSEETMRKSAKPTTTRGSQRREWS